MKAAKGFVVRTVRSMQPTHVHRVRIIGTALVSSTDLYLSLLKGVDDPNRDLISNGSDIAECKVNSKITKIQLTVVLSSYSAGEVTELLLHKDPDLAITTSFTVTSLFLADFTAVSSAVKKNSLVYRFFRALAVSDGARIGMGMKRKALRRAGKMNENDTLKLAAINGAFATNNTIDVVGRIWTKEQ